MITRLLYLVRHGEQDLTEPGEPASAEPDTGLSERGRRQATLLGERLRGVGSPPSSTGRCAGPRRPPS
ncbi:phosphoglycerate mutase family protein [Micromonospora sp. M12]